jgi:hypothetical protein
MVSFSEGKPPALPEDAYFIDEFKSRAFFLARDDAKQLAPPQVAKA